MIRHETDREHLTTNAYADGANLAARQSIYRFQQPQLHFVDWALELVDWKSVRTAIDVGCGNGAYLRRLTARVPRVIGIDLSRGMLVDAAHACVERQPLLGVGDAQALPFANECANAILAMHMLYHVPDILVALREMRRVLHREGVLLVATNGERHLRELFGVLVESVAAVDGELGQLRRSFMRFSSERALQFLTDGFESQWHPAVSELVVPEVEPVIEYFGSMRGWIEHALPERECWNRCMSAARKLLEQRIARDGAFRITTEAGVFVCRRRGD